MPTKINWTDETWNPIIGCSKVSAGCDNCYAEKMAIRLSSIESTKIYKNVVVNGAWSGLTVFVQDQLLKPAKWKKPRKIFVCSMGDLFHESIPFPWIDAVFSVMSDNDQHIYQVLTKRPKRMAKFYKWKKLQCGIPWQAKDNVWLGVTVEYSDHIGRIIDLLDIPAKIHFLSLEPLLGPLQISPALHVGTCCENENVINWVIAGGESGSNARPMHPEWVRSLRDQCKHAAVPFFFKQWGAWYTDWFNITTTEPIHKMFADFRQWTQKLWVKKGDACIDMDGKLCKCGGDLETATYPVAIMQKTGKDGNTLDGRKHEEFPKS